MARPRHTDPPRKVTINLPQSLVARIDLEMYDPVRQQTSYAGRSTLITSALRQYFFNLDQVRQELQDES